MEEHGCDIAMIGLGEMGQNLVLNMTDHGFSVAGYDRDPQRLQAMREHACGRPIRTAADIAGLISSLKKPRAVMMLVPASAPVDAVIQELLPRLAPGDLIVDGGNSFYRDTDTRMQSLMRRGILYLGVGISGGGKGARYGPSLMPGGPREGYDRIGALLEAITARVNGVPCVAYLGAGAAGHYVKMVHNGIEYGLMQLISESYDLMKRGLALSNDDLHREFAAWNGSELASYLMEITANIFLKDDAGTGRRLIDTILDEASQKGTGKWTSQDAMDLGIPIPTIDIAVSMRALSSSKDRRERAGRVLGKPERPFTGDRSGLLASLKRALEAAFIVIYAQGLHLLQAASGRYGYGLRLIDVTRVWRGGCIIRSAILERIYTAYTGSPEMEDLLTESGMGKEVLQRENDLRAVACTTASLGIPTPAFAASLAYFDARRSAWLPANLIQAQRDYFGAHTYRRNDMDGAFHTEWE